MAILQLWLLPQRCPERHPNRRPFRGLVQDQPGGTKRWFCYGWVSSCLSQHLNHPLLLLSLCLNQLVLLFSLSISFCLSFLFIPLGPELVHLHPLGQEPIHGIHCRKGSLWISAMGTFGVSCSSPLVIISTTKTTTTTTSILVNQGIDLQTF